MKNKEKNWKKEFDNLIRHKRHDVNKYEVNKCKYCKEWYAYTIKITKTIKDKKTRIALLDCWKTLWLNNCGDFDIIHYVFGERMRK